MSDTTLVFIDTAADDIINSLKSLFIQVDDDDVDDVVVKKYEQLSQLDTTWNVISSSSSSIDNAYDADDEDEKELLNTPL